MALKIVAVEEKTTGTLAVHNGRISLTLCSFLLRGYICRNRKKEVKRALEKREGEGARGRQKE